MQTKDPLLELRDVSVSYTGTPVLYGVSAGVRPGECILVTGDNGSGKSTLLRILAGVQAPTSGTRISRLAARDVRLMLQAPRLAWGLPVATNVALALSDGMSDISWQRALLHPHATRRRRDALHAAAEEILERFGLAAHAKTPAQEMSGGERKLLAVAIALAGKTPVVLLDEPFAGLTEVASGNVRAAIAEAKEEGRAIVIVEHRTKHAANVADRFWSLVHGELREVAGAVPPAQPAPSVPVASPTVLATEVILTVAGLRGGWGRNVVVEEATFQLPCGAIVGIMGENGSGKSTLVALLSGIIDPVAGLIVLAGNDVTHALAHERVRMGLRVLLQQRRVFSRLSIDENFRLGHREVRGDRLLSLNIDGGRLAGTLSGGEQTILGLHIASEGEGASVLVLDEPTAGLDRNSRARVLERLSMLREAGMASLIVEHDQHFLEELSDRILILQNGRLP